MTDAGKPLPEGGGAVTRLSASRALVWAAVAAAAAVVIAVAVAR